jgi:hypothetical protein
MILQNSTWISTNYTTTKHQNLPTTRQKTYQTMNTPYICPHRCYRTRNFNSTKQKTKQTEAAARYLILQHKTKPDRQSSLGEV